jgi:hypothetical protein
MFIYRASDKRTSRKGNKIKNTKLANNAMTPNSFLELNVVCIEW